MKWVWYLLEDTRYYWKFWDYVSPMIYFCDDIQDSMNNLFPLVRVPVACKCASLAEEWVQGNEDIDVDDLLVCSHCVLDGDFCYDVINRLFDWLNNGCN